MPKAAISEAIAAAHPELIAIRQDIHAQQSPRRSSSFRCKRS